MFRCDVDMYYRNDPSEYSLDNYQAWPHTINIARSTFVVVQHITTCAKYCTIIHNSQNYSLYLVESLIHDARLLVCSSAVKLLK